MDLGVVGSYVATGEVTTLEHELGDDTVEGGTSIAESLLASAESTEVLSSLGDDVVEEVEVDTTILFCDDVSVGATTMINKHDI
jgi:hypothetical protein